MLSQYFTEEHNLFRESLKAFIQKEVIPNSAEWEAKEEIPRAIWKKMGEMGYLGINYCEQYGGMNLDFFYSVIFLEEIAKSSLGGFAAAFSVSQFIACEYIEKVGTEAQKMKYLKPAIDGDFIGALAISEPNSGSDVAAIKTRAKIDGDDYIINGSKTFITNGFHGDFVVVACQTDDGISLIIVDKDTPGFTSAKLKKMGWHCSDTAELAFDNVRVPKSQLLGDAGKGFYYVMESFTLERLVASVMAVGGAEDAIDMTLQYMTEREAFGRPINKFQVLRHKIVEMAAKTEAIKQLTYNTAWLYNNGTFAVKEATMAKMLSTELGIEVANACLQMHGGYGFMDEYVITRMYRDARAGTIVGGTTEIMKEILAKIIIDDVKYKSVYKGDKKVEATAETTTKEEIVEEKTPETAREILYSLPRRIKKEKAAGLHSLFHFILSGDTGGEFTIEVKNSEVIINEGLSGTPDCIVKTKAKTYEDVELGRTNPQMAVMMGKIKISNLGEMMKFGGLFRKVQ